MTPRFCGASGSCTGVQAGEDCGGASCSSGQCVWDSCSAALAAGHTTSGTYTVDADGSGSLGPAPVYCDMTTDGGGWLLSYKIRNDVPDIQDPWWGMVDLGSGTALPTAPTAVAVGAHFEGPIRSTRAALAARIGAIDTRATLISSSNVVLFDVISRSFSTMGIVANGATNVLVATTPSDAPGVQVLASSTGFPSAGTTGYEMFETCPSGTCQDFDYFTTSPGAGTIVPIFGDTSIQSLGTHYVDTTTLFWIRQHM